MGSEHYCLKWNNHQSNLLGVFSQLLQDESLVDVTLACAEGPTIRAHKVVLSACSSYFQSLFVDHPNRYPIVILTDVCFAELRTLVEFMYKGEVNVEYCQLSALLKTAEILKVKGLAEMTNLNSTTTTSVKLDRDERGTDGAHAVQKQAAAAGAGETPFGAETANKRLKAEDAESGSPGRNSSPGPAPSKKPSRGPECEDASDCERDGPDAGERNDARGGCPGPADLSASGMASCQLPPSCSSPHVNDPFPGTSCLPPVQQVPLSLKKEVDWENKSTAGESSSDYRQPPDSQDCEEDVGDRSPRLYPCVYCGVRFPHQSKLTRHILSHSLETLKYREQPHLQMPHSILSLDQLNLVDSHFGNRSHKYEPFEQPPDVVSDTDFSGSFPLGEAGQTSVALCKYCSKPFPDVNSYVAHLTVHTGDRPFKCEFCGKAFKLRHHMKDHCRVHTGERPFRCSICGKTFSRSTILKAHEKTHYPKFVHKFFAPSPVEHHPEDSQVPLTRKFPQSPLDSHADAGSPQPQQ